jgi:dissimilatory sulfite reductase (desulfoviridin) alpha/beta subunit
MTKEFNLNNGSIVLIAEIDGGVYSASHLKKIAHLCESVAQMVKATEDQRLALMVKADQVAHVTSELKSIGLEVRNYQSGLHQPVACMGALCPEHEQDALGTAMDISSELAGISTESPVKIGVNGCARCCTPCHTLDVSIIGEYSGYRIAIGGKNAQYPEFASLVADGIPASETPKAIRSILETYQSHSQEGESLQETVERIGISAFSESISPKTAETEAMTGSDVKTGEDNQNQITNEQGPQDSDLSAAMSHVATAIREIPVRGADSSSIFDVPINLGASGTPDIRIKEVELAEDDTPSSEESPDSKAEDEIEAKLTASISELAEASEQYQSVMDREKNTELLATAPVAFDDPTGPSNPAEDAKLEHDLIDITNRLTHLENDLRREASDLVQNNVPGGWELDGFDVDERGNPVVVWKNGIKTIIDCSNQKSGSIFVGKRKINFSVLRGEVQVELDGIRMVLPLAA